jgi:transposase
MGPSPERRQDIAPLVDDLIDWMRHERAKLSRQNDVAISSRC